MGPLHIRREGPPGGFYMNEYASKSTMRAPKAIIQLET